MFIKPKKTNLNPRALLYKRYTHIEKMLSGLTIFACLKVNSTYDYFIFDKELMDFVKIDIDTIPQTADKIYTITNNNSVFTYGGYFFYWRNQTEWIKSDTLPQTYTTLQEAGYANVGRYQMNTYIYAGSFDYVVKGSIVGTRTQNMKGLITPLTSLNIQYYNDYINVEVGDLVVIKGQLFSVENPETDIKHLPKDYKVYSVTLNSIL